MSKTNNDKKKVNITKKYHVKDKQTSKQKKKLKKLCSLEVNNTNKCYM